MSKTKITINKFKNTEELLNTAKTKKKKKQIVVFTYGACKNNGKANAIGGIGVHFPNEELDDISKPFLEEPITNQRAELCAIYTALKEIRKKIGLSEVSVLIKSDSDYSIKASSVWPKSWEKNGWKTAANQPVKNLDIIVKIHHYVQKYDITFEHVYAHTGGTDYDSVHNHVADRLAVTHTLSGGGMGSKTSAKNNGMIKVEKIMDEEPSKHSSRSKSSKYSSIKSSGSVKNSGSIKSSGSSGSSGSKSCAGKSLSSHFVPNVYKSNVSHNQKVKVELVN